MLRQREQCEKRSERSGSMAWVAERLKNQVGGPGQSCWPCVVQVEGALTLHLLSGDHPLPIMGSLVILKQTAKPCPTPVPPLQLKKCQFPPLEMIIR